MNGCPPKPGFTVMMSNWSICRRNGIALEIAVGGLTATPTFMFMDRIFQINGSTRSPNST
jgi:hypothetical protein